MTLQTELFMLRRDAGMKQEELATIVGVRRETIGLLEHGKYNPSLNLALDIASVFGKNVEEIFTFYPETEEEIKKAKNIKAKNSELRKKAEQKETQQNILKALAPEKF